MKWLVVLAAVLLLCGGFPVGAATVRDLYTEQWEASGGRELLEALPDDTRDLLSRLGIDTLEPLSLTELDTPTVLEHVFSLARTVLSGPLAAAGMLLAIVILYAWVDGMRHTLRSEESAAVFGTVCALAACGSVLAPLSACIGQVSEAMTSVSVFMGSFTPVYAAILLSGGHAATALSFQSIVLYASQLMAWFAGGVIVPLMTVSLALGVTGSVTPQVNLGGAGKLIGKTAVWLLTFGMLLFTGLLSLQSFVSSAADGIGTRALKFSLSSFVPVVGGSLSELFTTVRGCLQLLRSTLGGFGVLATALILLPPLLRCFGWSILLSVCRTAAELFELRPMIAVLETARSTVKCLIGVLSACGTFLVIAVTVVTAAAGG